VARTGRDLTPAQHARIRLHLALIPAYIVLVSGWVDLVRRLPVGPGSEGHRVRDFAAIAYIPGVIANQGDASLLYDTERRAAMLRALLPDGPLVRYPPFYGPQISVIFSPLARLPYEWALVAWMAITVAVFMACGYAIWRVCPRLRDRWDAVLVLLLADATLFYTLSFVQISAIALVCVTGAFLALRANRPLLAGVCIGSLIYKPSLGVAFGIVLVFAAATEHFQLWRRASALRSPSPGGLGHFRQREAVVVVGAIAGAVAQLAVGALFWGPSIVSEYLRAQIRLIPDMRDEFYIHHLHSWRGFFEILGLPNAVAQTGYVIAAALVLAVAFRCWRSTAPLQVRFAVLLIATVLVNPHGYVYDSIILMPAFLLLWDWAEQQPTGFALKFEWLLYFCYLAPLFTVVALVARLQLSVPALTLLGLAAVRRRLP
jgi:alpha-1,2-mannosyltransferase